MDIQSAIKLSDINNIIPIDENFKLIGGPGSGKTTFLVEHIKNVVSKSTKVNNGSKILCITHTNIAVDSIKEKLDNSLNNVEVSTIHSFLYKHVFRPYCWILSDEFEFINNLSTIKEAFVSFSRLPKDDMNKREWGKLLNSYSLDDIFSQLNKIRWNFDGEDFKLYCPGRIFFSDNYLWSYKKKLWKDNSLSPDDILFFSYKILLKNSFILDIIRIKFPYIFIDEFQDISQLQFKILDLFYNKNIFFGIIGDSAQSIYDFHGADVNNLENFGKEDFNLYLIENNKRSPSSFVNVFNHVRNDGLIQKSLKKEKGNPPILFVCDDISSYDNVNLIDEDVYILAYEHKTLNSLYFKINHNNSLEENFIKYDEFKDHRKLTIKYSIMAIESFRNVDIEYALKYLDFAYRKFEFDKAWLIKKLFWLSENYEKFVNISITDFYNIFIRDDDIKGLSTIKGGNVKNTYDSVKYSDLMSHIIKENNSILFRTIHSCKGAEFDNILLLLENEEDLNFILMPNIMRYEKYRLFYVAISRAKKNLFINVPSLSTSNENKLINLNLKVIHR